jgi:hypothetical protein
MSFNFANRRLKILERTNRTMAEEEQGVAGRGNDEMARRNSYENLDLSFDDIPMMEDLLESKDPSVFTKPGAAEPTKEQGKGGVITEYILGTLVIRVVAARELESAGPSGLGKLFFGGDNRSSGSNRSGRQGASANPYASVRFGNTTQRTSEVFHTVDPIWPRGEAMYMDVIHSAWDNTLATAASGTTSEVDTAKVEPSISPTAKKIPDQSKTKKAPPTSPSDDTTTSEPLEQALPILTVAIFHASEKGKLHKHPTKAPLVGDSDDKFLGMTAVDLTKLLTGKIRTFDEWLPLSGSNSDRASVRIVCEYEPSDGEPQSGDLVRFTHFCHPADLYPLHRGKLFKVEECEGDNVLISYTSPEGWVSSVMAHRCMLICEARHHGAVEMYQDELASISQRIAHSPLVSVVQESVLRVPEEGLVGVGVDAVRGGASLLTRWIQVRAWEMPLEPFLAFLQKNLTPFYSTGGYYYSNRRYRNGDQLGRAFQPGRCRQFINIFLGRGGRSERRCPRRRCFAFTSRRRSGGL